METTAPVETKSSRAPLVLGFLLVALGGLLFLGTVFHWQIWAAPWHFIGPLLPAPPLLPPLPPQPQVHGPGPV